MVESFVELEYLTETEKKKLEMVLNRNKKLNQKENARLKRLCSTDISANDQSISDSYSDYNKSTRSLNINSETFTDDVDDNSNKKSSIDILGNCSSCGIRFSILPWSCASSNTNSCTLCKSKMCKKCTHHLDRPNIEICKACHKNILFEAKSGKWFYNKNKKDPDSEESGRSSSVMSNDRWILVDKLSSMQKDFGSADNLESQGSTNVLTLPNKNVIPKRKFNNSAYFRTETSTNRGCTSPEITESPLSPFRRMNKSLNIKTKPKCLNVNSCLDMTLKSEDSGCALDMDEETVSEKGIKISGGTNFESKCYFRPLRIINPNNSLNDPITNELQNCLSFSQPHIDNIANYNQSKYVGDMMLSFLYDPTSSILNITIHRCRNLVTADPFINSINPYVILFLRPNRPRQNKQKTRCQYKTTNPVYEEYFLINLDAREVEHTQSLVILLCHKNDKTGKDLAVGQLAILIEEIMRCDQINRWFHLVRMNSAKISSPDHRSLSSKQGYMNSNVAVPSPLSDCMSSSSSNDFKSNAFLITGEMTLALKFVFPSLGINKKNGVGELHIWIKSAKILDFESSSDDQSQNSPKIKVENNRFGDTDSKQHQNKKSSGHWLNDILGYNNPIAKAHLFTNNGVVNKEMSATKFLEKGGYYIWSSIMKFESDLSDLMHATLEISLWIHSNNSLLNKILPSRCVGSVFLGQSSDMQKTTSRTAADSKLWHAMLAKHNIWIDETLVLKNRKDRL